MNQLQEEAAYYAVITAPVRYDPELSSTAKLLYSEITSLCRKKGYCWANNSYFAELYGVSASTISRLVSQLESRGHIKTEIVPVANGSERRIYADPYAVNHAGISHFEDEGQGSQEGGTQKAQGGLRKNSKGGLRKKRKQNDYHMNDYTEDTPYSPPAGDSAPAGSAPEDKPAAPKSRREKSMPAHDPEAFETFWTAYPRKDDRKKAIRAWDKLKPDKSLCRVMYDALKRQRASEQWAEAGGKFIPLFSTWLNGCKWEDQGVDLSLLDRSRASSGYWASDPEAMT